MSTTKYVNRPLTTYLEVDTLYIGRLNGTLVSYNPKGTLYSHHLDSFGHLVNRPKWTFPLPLIM